MSEDISEIDLSDITHELENLVVTVISSEPQARGRAASSCCCSICCCCCSSGSAK